MGLFGPTIASHQPGEGSASAEAACAEGDKPVKIKTPLSFAAFKVPQVSKAIAGECRTPPNLSSNGPFK